MRTRLAFAASVAGTLVLGVLASAQAVPSIPDVIVSVRKARLGADMVTVVARQPDYPPELLRRQIVALGERLGSPARGVEVHREAAAALVKGSCGVDGMIDRASGYLGIAPLAQAFAGAPAPFTVTRMLVSFDGETPTDRTPAYHTTGKGSDLAFSGRPVDASIEYQVELRSQDPSRLVVNANAVPTPLAKPKVGPDRLALGLLAAAVVAAGALVYCLILLLGRRPLSKS